MARLLGEEAETRRRAQGDGERGSGNERGEAVMESGGSRAAKWWVELWRLSESEGEEAVVVGEAQGKEDGDVRRET
eukprot:scaffold330046_cov53-Tisochrysis_lutea.AAC.1